MISIQEIRKHRNKYNLDIPNECNGFKIDDHVEYSENNEIRRGYILCFRRFGNSWFAWIYFDKKTLRPEDCIFIGNLKKIEE